jgi:hypothetical protein
LLQGKIILALIPTVFAQGKTSLGLLSLSFAAIPAGSASRKTYFGLLSLSFAAIPAVSASRKTYFGLSLSFAIILTVFLQVKLISA